MCYICLRDGHNTRTCDKTCSRCQKRHHVAICYGNKGTQDQVIQGPSESKEKFSVSKETVTTSAIASSDNILLQTAVSSCFNPDGSCTPINILFDKGSQRSYVTEEFTKRLRLLEVRKEKCKIHTFGSCEGFVRSCSVVEVPLNTRTGLLRIHALTIPTICKTLRQSCHSRFSKNLNGLDLSNANVKGEVHLLIGCDNYWSIVNGEIRNKYPGPVAMNSSIGWLISGKSSSNGSHPSTTTLVCTNMSENYIEESDSFDSLFLRTLELEAQHVEDKDDVDSEATLSKFHETVEFNGRRYSVSLPWRSGLILENNNFKLAYSRLLGLIQRLKKASLLEAYSNIIEDYLKKDYIEEASNFTENSSYLPHHCVIKEDKATTKVRIVFDGSAKSSNTLSLNECLYKGPSLITDIVPQLLKFRSHRAIVISDIQEAFLQIELKESDRDYVRFLWVTEGKLVCYRFKRVPFGLSSSPFLLNATIRFHLQKHKVPFADNFYVDDLIVGGEDIHEAMAKGKLINDTMKLGGFTLRKWASNKPLSLPDSYHKAGDAAQKVLGIHWNLEHDYIKLDSQAFKSSEVGKYVTKRLALSAASKIFDPLGLVSCVTIRLRAFFQKLCKEKIGWDEKLDEKLTKEFEQLLKDLNIMEEIKINRCVFAPADSRAGAELHVFSDASSIAYGAAIYIRYPVSGGFEAHLVRSKSRVTPIKKVSIPKLELSAAIVGYKLQKELSEIDIFKGLEVYFWTDSMAVLHWIKGTRQWPVYVENRVKLIREDGLCNNYYYVETTQNPADLLSRGLSCSEVRNNGMWWHGPNFLKSDIVFNKETHGTSLGSSQVLMTKTDTIERVIQIERFSKFLKLCRTVAFVKRFINNAQRQALKSGPLQAEEIIEAEKFILKQEQKEHFSEEISHLSKQSPIPKGSKVRRLDLILDEHGLLRVGTRLTNTVNNLIETNPFLIPSKGALARLIILRYHERCLHSGAIHTLAEIRKKYWITNGRQAVKSVIKKCIVCKRYEGKPYASPSAPPLPKFRIDKTFPFLNTGIDFAGPLSVKVNMASRTHKIGKAYICLFTCAVTRAVHLEMVLSLTTEDFILAFKRFSCRRGFPTTIYTDNGATFQGASKEIAKFINDKENKAQLQEYCCNEAISWHFICPRAPWWGGFYERLVGLVKRLLKKILGNSLVTYLELETVLIEIEAVLNDRPLTYLSSEENTEILTPFLLLLGRSPSTKVTKIDAETDACNAVQRRKYQKLLAHQFWNVYYRDYLVSLREHFSRKQSSGCGSVETGDVVHVYRQGPRSQWRLAIVDEVIPGRDGKIRAAKVKFPINGSQREHLTRPINHLYPLEINQKETPPTTKSLLTTCSKTAIVSFFLMSLLLFITPCLSEKSLCDQLSCYNEAPGQIAKYAIYNQNEWMSVKAYLCSRQRTVCHFEENFIWQKWKTCKQKHVPIGRQQCLMMARDRHSFDGFLHRKAKRLFSTNNSIKETYEWWSTVVRKSYNSYLEIIDVKTNGILVNSTIEISSDKCLYEDGKCIVPNKILTWRIEPLCNLTLDHNEVCHQKGNEVYCEESDFEIIQHDESVCGQHFHSTKQGSYLQITHKNDHLHRKHRLNAAVIQHLENRIEMLERKLQCVSQNQFCYNNITVAKVHHQSYQKFYKDHEVVEIAEKSIDEVIKEEEQEVIDNIVEEKESDSSIISLISELPDTLSKVIIGVSTGVALIALLAICIKCGIPMLAISLLCGSKSKGNNHRNENIRQRSRSEEMEMPERPLNRERSCSTSSPLMHSTPKVNQLRRCNTTRYV